MAKRGKKKLVSGRQSKWVIGVYFGFIAAASSCFALFGLAALERRIEPEVNLVKGVRTVDELKQKIETAFQNTVGKAPGNSSFILVNLDNPSQSYSYRPDKIFVSASLYKLFIAYKTYEAYEVDDIKPTTSLNRCLKIMITISDNDCGFRLGNLLGWPKIDRQLANNGYDSTVLDNYSNSKLFGNKYTSANDVAILLKKLHSGELLNKTNTNKLISQLFDQELNSRIPAKLPKGVTIGHKTGNLDGNVHDAGLIYNKNGDNFAYVIMSSGWRQEENGEKQMNRFIKEIVM